MNRFSSITIDIGVQRRGCLATVQKSANFELFSETMLKLTQFYTFHGITYKSHMYIQISQRQSPITTITQLYLYKYKPIK
jgi:hypothetical protein